MFSTARQQGKTSGTSDLSQIHLCGWHHMPPLELSGVGPHALGLFGQKKPPKSSFKFLHYINIFKTNHIFLHSLSFSSVLYHFNAIRKKIFKRLVSPWSLWLIHEAGNQKPPNCDNWILRFQVSNQNTSAKLFEDTLYFNNLLEDPISFYCDTCLRMNRVYMSCQGIILLMFNESPIATSTSNSSSSCLLSFGRTQRVNQQASSVYALYVNHTKSLSTNILRPFL